VSPKSTILALNSGSSSLKFGLFDAGWQAKSIGPAVTGRALNSPCGPETAAP
jgi:acetate kinase